MKLIKSVLVREIEDYRILLRNIPSLVISMFILSVVLMNLLANKELVSYKYLAMDCGYVLSWLSFLCMDMICKRFGSRASAKVAVLALGVNLCVTILFKLISASPGMWGEYYSTGSGAVNDALNATFAGSWYVVFGSSVAMLVSAITNSVINGAVAKRLTCGGYKAFALRSFVSTGIAQFVDNLTFTAIVSVKLFGWTWTQVFVCSFICAMIELLCEAVFSPVGYRISRHWEDENVGEQYLIFASRKDTL